MSFGPKLLAGALATLLCFAAVSVWSDETYFRKRFHDYNAAREALPIADSDAQQIARQTERGGSIDIDPRVDAIAISIFQEYLTKDQLPGLKECLEFPSCRLYALATFKAWAPKTYTVTGIDEQPGYVELSYEGVDGNDIEGEGYVSFIKEDGRWKIRTESFSRRREKSGKINKGTE